MTLRIRMQLFRLPITYSLRRERLIVVFIVLVRSPTIVLGDNSPTCKSLNSFRSRELQQQDYREERNCLQSLRSAQASRKSRVNMDVELKIWRNLETFDFGKWKVQPKEWKWLGVRASQVFAF